MNNSLEVLGYRASIGAIIVNEKKQFLFGRLVGKPEGKFDFIKGGMHEGELRIETLKREIEEELGSKVEYEILAPSNWFLVYEWPPEYRRAHGFMGQARASFWVLYKNGEIVFDKEELVEIKWVDEKDVYSVLRGNDSPEFVCETFLREWEEIQRRFEVFK